MCEKTKCDVGVNLYLIVHDCVERGIVLGISRARKHKENPTDADISMCVSTEVMNELSEYIDFGDFYESRCDNCGKDE